MVARILLTVGMVIIPLAVKDAEAASTDRNTLYAITPTGTVLQIDTTTGGGTVLRQLPWNGAGDYYGTLSVYKGTFLTAGPYGEMAFGLSPNDELRLGAFSQSSKTYDLSSYLNDLTEYPSTGLSRGWTSRATSPDYTSFVFYQRELDPINRVEYPISSTDIYPVITHDPYWTCFPQSDSRASAFFGSNRSYFVQNCWRNDGYSAGVGNLIRADLSGGTWSKTLDVIGITYNPSALAADPANDGVLYSGFFIPSPPQTSSNLQKYVISGSTITGSNLQTINGIPGITGLAYGPPASDVPEPKNITELAPFAQHPWTPIQMLLDHH